MHGNKDELRRILEMVESGRISAADGAKLLKSATDNEIDLSNRCPYCAESISALATICPECGSNLTMEPVPTSQSSFHALSGLGKFLIIYTLLVSGLLLMTKVFPFGGYISPASLFGGLLALLGLAAGILMLKGRAGGWTLGILWSALQIITVLIRGQIINQQVFHLGANFHSNGLGLGFNLVGVILLILFIKAKPEHMDAGSFTHTY